MAKGKGSTNPLANRLEIHVTPDKHELVQQLKVRAEQRGTSVSALVLSLVEQDIYIPPAQHELVQKLKVYAELQGTSVSAVMLKLAEKWVRKEEIKLRKARRQ